jgi:hypothetical protein
MAMTLKDWVAQSRANEGARYAPASQYGDTFPTFAQYQAAGGSGMPFSDSDEDYGGGGSGGGSGGGGGGAGMGLGALASVAPLLAQELGFEIPAISSLFGPDKAATIYTNSQGLIADQAAAKLAADAAATNAAPTLASVAAPTTATGVTAGNVAMSNAALAAEGGMTAGGTQAGLASGAGAGTGAMAAGGAAAAAVAFYMAMKARSEGKVDHTVLDKRRRFLEAQSPTQWLAHAEYGNRPEDTYNLLKGAAQGGFQSEFGGPPVEGFNNKARMAFYANQDALQKAVRRNEIRTAAMESGDERYRIPAKPGFGGENDPRAISYWAAMDPENFG